MSKKRQKKKAVSTPNINKVIVEIDYDKLANTILAVQQRVDISKEDIQGQEEKFGLIKVIWWILRNKKNTHERMTMAFMAIPIMFLFKIISIVGFISVVGLIWSGISQGISMQWDVNSIIDNVLSLSLLVWGIIMVFFCSLIMWGVASEIEKTEDKHFLAAVFSGIISLAALIISIIAIKG